VALSSRLRAFVVHIHTRSLWVLKAEELLGIGFADDDLIMKIGGIE
jgi:hypothetical protein